MHHPPLPQHMEPRQPEPAFWQGRRVLLTGHTGFKGTWLGLMLTHLGAHIVGLALEPPPGPSLFTLLAREMDLAHHIADLRDPAATEAVLTGADASVVFHLGAQALVPLGFAEPAATFATNLGGTINLLQAMRGRREIEGAVLVTTDKVYRNFGDGRRFREDDPLGGDDPYSASKAAAELAVASWRASFGTELPAMATARAGNVIGGGDFAASGWCPTLFERYAATPRWSCAIRMLHVPGSMCSTVLRGYLMLAEDLVQSPTTCPTTVNFGPVSGRETSVVELIRSLGHAFGHDLPWQQDPLRHPEAPRLALDASLAVQALGWHPRFEGSSGIAATAAWYAAWRRNDAIVARCMREVAEALAIPRRLVADQR